MIMYECYAGFFALYYSLSFSCYFAKIFSMATSFCMTSFAAAQRMTTAEPLEPLAFPAFRIHYIQTKHIGACRPGGKAFRFIQCILWTLH
jgi:hypothetical protein